MGSKSEDVASRERIAELLVEILDHCGVWARRAGEDQNNSWERLAASLKKLSISLEKLKKAESQEGVLLELEEAAQDVRVQSQQLLASENRQEILEALDLCRELEGICRRKKIYRILALSLSLTNCIRRQREDITKVLTETLQYMSQLYEDVVPNKQIVQSDLVASLRAGSTSLSLRCINQNQAPWKDAKDLVKILLSRDDSADDSLSMKRVDLLGVAPTIERRAMMEPEALAISTTFDGTTSFGTLLEEGSIVDVAVAFAEDRGVHTHSSKCFLVVGPQGSGKTFCLDRIESRVPATGKVIRPSLPYDAMGRKVGSVEDLLISMVACSMGKDGKTLLLLDDIESICGSNYEEITTTATGGETISSKGSASEPHLTARTRQLLLSLLEVVHRSPNSNVMLICTARNHWGKVIDRFDKIFVLENPTDFERRELIRTHMSKCLTNADAKTVADDAILSNLVECTSGLAHAELTFHCRGALLDASRNKAGSLGFLTALKAQLQQAIPDSLKTGASSDFVDMKVSTFRDLRDIFIFPSSEPEDTSVKLSLYGHSIEYAWEELKRLIITPICHARALHELMCHDDSAGGKTFAGGVLVTGDPGSGKTSLAYQCAALAASMNPSVKLLDVSCTSLIHKQVGSSEQAIHRLFQTAKSAAPCILLMDGIENIAAVRGNDNTTEGTMDRVLSTLLTELDGVDSESFSPDNPACIAIIGITHNPNWVDPALRRPGRLERVIELGLPELEARAKIVERELSGIPIKGFGDLDGDDSPGVTSAVASFVAERTEGFSGAAVVGVCNEAKMRASKEMLHENVSDDYQYSITIHHMKDAINSQRAGKAVKK